MDNTRIHKIYNRDLYQTFTHKEVSLLLKVDKLDLYEVAHKLKIGKIEGIYRYTKPQVEQLRSYINGNPTL